MTLPDASQRSAPGGNNREFEARVSGLERRTENIRRERDLKARDAVLDEAEQDGKITAEQRPAFARAFMADPAATTAILASMPADRAVAFANSQPSEAESRDYAEDAAGRLGIPKDKIV